MAPYAAPSLQQIIDMLADPDVERRLPLSTGGPAGPTAQIGLRDGRWCLYRLAIDGVAYDAFIEALREANEPLFPEHRMRFLVPGEILLQADGRTELLALLRKRKPWLDDDYQVQLRAPGWFA
ncbi:hypothetical protein [Paraliomyxa miuraensis]|uniref:hypothetical protein n=1 Tax=Paraliomyxa miuraensis TaxID=376150 RepID=UPI0022581F93|nr:hypothetical protein [Paraliomyxa miuraensis]MCX4245663.1 hypothetical protein [Paraliomyxa miuraensis]